MHLSYLAIVDASVSDSRVKIDEERGKEEELWAKKKEAKPWQL